MNIILYFFYYINTSLAHQDADRTDRPGDQIRAGTNGDCVLHTRPHHDRPGLRILDLRILAQAGTGLSPTGQRFAHERAKLKCVNFAQGLGITKFQVPNPVSHEQDVVSWRGIARQETRGLLPVPAMELGGLAD